MDLWYLILVYIAYVDVSALCLLMLYVQWYIKHLVSS